MLPEFDDEGDLPPGVYQATLGDVVERFGSGTDRRRSVTRRLQRVIDIARSTGKLERVVVFGSYVTAKPNPNDVDILLVMRNDFDVSEYDEHTKSLFDHLQSQSRFGASVFSIRPSTVLLETVDQFIAFWQIKRDQSEHGIVEITLEKEK